MNSVAADLPEVPSSPALAKPIKDDGKGKGKKRNAEGKSKGKGKSKSKRKRKSKNGDDALLQTPMKATASFNRGFNKNKLSPMALSLRLRRQRHGARPAAAPQAEAVSPPAALQAGPAVSPPVTPTPAQPFKELLKGLQA